MRGTAVAREHGVTFDRPATRMTTRPTPLLLSHGLTLDQYAMKYARVPASCQLRSASAVAGKLAPQPCEEAECLSQRRLVSMLDRVAARFP